jgi:hypothetical protein
MSHFTEILSFRDNGAPHRRSTLFSVPSDVILHPAERPGMSIRRYFVGTIGVAEVVSTGHETFVAEPTCATLILPRHGRLVSATADGVEQVAMPGQALLFGPNRRQTRVERAPDHPFVGIRIIIPRDDFIEAAVAAGARSRGSGRAIDQLAHAIDGRRSPEMRDLLVATRCFSEAVAADAPVLLSGDAPGRGSGSSASGSRRCCRRRARSTCRTPRPDGWRPGTSRGPSTTCRRTIPTS